ncbi:MAG: YybH family protein [Bacteroidia bacterium]
MKQLIVLSTLLFFYSCSNEIDKEDVKKQIFKQEKAFEAMLKKEGIPQAFAFYADSNAIIKREEDKLIQGKRAIFEYYSSDKFDHVELSWTPDFIDVSDDGTMAYTYGRYVWKKQMGVDSYQINEGVFHTVWKKQMDGNWKYVWD